jgi:hypothetical protein
LHNKGYADQAQRSYQRLVLDLQKNSQAQLIEDLQRTSMLINPAEPQSDNLIWRYHWSVAKELEKRSEANLVKALKLAGDR